jgi:hypothetical protein
MVKIRFFVPNALHFLGLKATSRRCTTSQKREAREMNKCFWHILSKPPIHPCSTVLLYQKRRDVPHWYTSWLVLLFERRVRRILCRRKQGNKAAEAGGVVQLAFFPSVAMPTPTRWADRFMETTGFGYYWLGWVVAFHHVAYQRPPLLTVTYHSCSRTLPRLAGPQCF